MFLDLMLADVRGIVSDVRPHDFGPLFFWGMWFWIVFSSLKNVDRRDEIAQLTYMAFTGAFGVVFVMVFPIGRSTHYTPAGQIITFSVLLLIPSIRWMVRRRVSELDQRVEAAKREIIVKP